MNRWGRDATIRTHRIAGTFHVRSTFPLRGFHCVTCTLWPKCWLCSELKSRLEGSARLCSSLQGIKGPHFRGPDHRGSLRHRHGGVAPSPFRSSAALSASISVLDQASTVKRRRRRPRSSPPLLRAVQAHRGQSFPPRPSQFNTPRALQGVAGRSTVLYSARAAACDAAQLCAHQQGWGFAHIAVGVGCC